MRHDEGYAARRVAARLAGTAAWTAALCALFPLFAILFCLVERGASSLSLAFFTELPAPRGAGMTSAIVGTIELVLLASAMAIPVGIAAGLWLAEHRDAPLARAVRLASDVLAGAPSILVGIVVWATVVVRMRSYSALAGALSLAALMLPLVARVTDELAREVPSSLREAALALGAPRWRIATQVVLRTAAPGIGAGCMLAVARVAGETAPLLFTAYHNGFWADGLLQPTSSLQVQIFTYTMSPGDDRHAQAWAASLVLVAIVVALDQAARRAIRRGRGP